MKCPKCGQPRSSMIAKTSIEQKGMCPTCYQGKTNYNI